MVGKMHNNVCKCLLYVHVCMQCVCLITLIHDHILYSGYEQYGLMRTDDALVFKRIAGPEKPVTRKSRSKGKS